MNRVKSILFACAALAAGFIQDLRIRFAPRLALANEITASTHMGPITYQADTAFTSRYLMAKIGSDAYHVALAGIGDIPIGVINDEAAAAGDQVAINLLDVGPGTMIGVASAAIAAGDMLVIAANGQLRTLPVTAGTYYIVGRALWGASAANERLEFIPNFPTQRIV